MALIIEKSGNVKRIIRTDSKGRIIEKYEYRTGRSKSGRRYRRVRGRTKEGVEIERYKEYYPKERVWKGYEKKTTKTKVETARKEEAKPELEKQEQVYVDESGQPISIAPEYAEKAKLGKKVLPPYVAYYIKETWQPVSYEGGIGYVPVVKPLSEETLKSIVKKVDVKKTYPGFSKEIERTRTHVAVHETIVPESQREWKYEHEKPAPLIAQLSTYAPTAEGLYAHAEVISELEKDTQKKYEKVKSILMKPVEKASDKNILKRIYRGVTEVASGAVVSPFYVYTTAHKVYGIGQAFVYGALEKPTKTTIEKELGSGIVGVIDTKKKKYLEETFWPTLKKTAKQVPKVMWEQYSPLKPENWPRISVAAFSAYSLGKSFATARATPKDLEVRYVFRRVKAHAKSFGEPYKTEYAYAIVKSPSKRIYGSLYLKEGGVWRGFLKYGRKRILEIKLLPEGKQLMTVATREWKLSKTPKTGKVTVKTVKIPESDIGVIGYPEHVGIAKHTPYYARTYLVKRYNVIPLRKTNLEKGYVETVEGYGVTRTEVKYIKPPNILKARILTLKKARAEGLKHQVEVDYRNFIEKVKWKFNKEPRKVFEERGYSHLRQIHEELKFETPYYHTYFYAKGASLKATRLVLPEERGLFEVMIKREAYNPLEKYIFIRTPETILLPKTEVKTIIQVSPAKPSGWGNIPKQVSVLWKGVETAFSTKPVTPMIPIIPTIPYQKTKEEQILFRTRTIVPFYTLKKKYQYVTISKPSEIQSYIQKPQSITLPKPTVRTFLGVKTKTTPVTQNLTQLVSATPTGFKPVRVEPVFVEIPTGFKLKSLILGKLPKIEKTKLTKREPEYGLYTPAKYTPSLFAIVKGIFAKVNLSKVTKKRFTGFEIRPIPLKWKNLFKGLKWKI